MTPTRMIRVPFFVMMTITLFAYSGCKPASEKEAKRDVTPPEKKSPEPKTESTTPKAENKEPEARIAPTIIRGELNSIDWQTLIGKRISITGNLVVVDNYDLARRGQIKVARKRLYVPTNRIDPNDADAKANSFEGGSNVAQVTKAQKLNDTATITIDDGSADENIFPPTLFPNLGNTHPTVRIGSTLDGVSGKLVKAGRNLLLVADQPLQWKPAGRPERPDVGEASAIVSSFNVLNYFTTIDNGSNNARGADSDSEFERQEAKLVAAIIALKADVIGLMEIENNIEAENQLVAALNKKIGQEVFKGCGLPEKFRESPGGQNAIRVGIIYRADRVEPVGKVKMIPDEAFAIARTPIVQTFKSKTAENPFTVIVNHFKSKGSSRADEANKNKGDGQGAYNATRRSQSLAICNYIEELKQDDASPRVLVIGDLNAYGQEDPIDAMRANGLVDLQERFGGHSEDGGDYSFVYYGQCGSLDHAMATDALANDITGIATWHINADEPRFLDYNEEHNPKPLYEANPFRSSDHDPVLIGIGK